MLSDWVSNRGPLTYESGALPIALRGPAINMISRCVSYRGLTKVNISLKQLYAKPFLWTEKNTTRPSTNATFDFSDFLSCQLSKNQITIKVVLSLLILPSSKWYID